MEWFVSDDNGNLAPYVDGLNLVEVLRQEAVGNKSITLSTSGWYKIMLQGQGVEFLLNEVSIAYNNLNQRQIIFLPIKQGNVLKVTVANASTYGTAYLC